MQKQRLDIYETNADAGRKYYISRINKVMDYISANLEKDIPLEQAAKVAGFSTYYFHRIFSSMVGETCHQFTKRIRLEKAAARLKNEPAKSITEIAFECGFSGSDAFSRAFSQHFGITPSAWRESDGTSMEIRNMSDSKICQTNGNGCQAISVDIDYCSGVSNNFLWSIKMKNGTDFKVEVKQIPDMPVVYIRNIGPYKGDEALFGRLFGRLFQWAGARGLISEETKCISVYHDDPSVTEDSKLRLDVCLTVPPGTAVDGEVGKAVISGGSYAVSHFEILPHQYEDAWAGICGSWLPASGYLPDDRPCFEVYLNSPKDHPEGKHIVDIYLPVKPL